MKKQRIKVKRSMLGLNLLLTFCFQLNSEWIIIFIERNDVNVIFLTTVPML